MYFNMLIAEINRGDSWQAGSHKKAAADYWVGAGIFKKIQRPIYELIDINAVCL